MSSASAPIPAAPNAGDPAAAVLSAKDRRRLHKAAVEMEAIFLKEFLKAGKTGISQGLFGGGFAEDLFEGFMDEERAKSMAESGGVGLARMLEDELLRAEGGAKVKKKPAEADNLNRRTLEADNLNRRILLDQARKSYP